MFLNSTIALFQVTIPLADKLGGFFSFMGGTGVGRLVSNLVGALMVFGTILALLYLVWGAVMWVTSGGDKANVEAARNRITQSILGLAILMAIWAFWLILNRFFGLPLSVGGPGVGPSGVSGVPGGAPGVPGGIAGVKAGCEIVNKPIKPGSDAGCWCRVGDWQFHCCDDKGCNPNCESECRARNGQPL